MAKAFEIITSKNIYPMGVSLKDGILHVCLERAGSAFGIILFDSKKTELGKIDFTSAPHVGKVYYGDINLKGYKKILYKIYADDKFVGDSFMRNFDGKSEFGFPVKDDEVYFVAEDSSYDWEDDDFTIHPYNETFMYLMHVRGFTKHPSSKVNGKGCFSGVAEKIDYLKELGINNIEMMPVTELKKNSKTVLDPTGNLNKINYWGYQNSYYYCPNKSLAKSKDAPTEFKDMVKALHKNGIELILQFYFPDEVKRGEIKDILVYWRSEFHVDGFRLKGDNLPKRMLNEAPELKECKLIYDYIDKWEIDETDEIKRIASYQDDYMYDMRRFLKGDEGVTDIALRHMRENPDEFGVIRFFTNYYGFTLRDLVSFDRKHNEDNGENNMDGAAFNLSWNCGVEGTSRKASINKLRMKQTLNALTMLTFTQGTPLIFMGDEFGNSQKGNNNPYCQDNAVTWLNWANLDQNKALFDLTVKLFAYRKAHQCIHPSKALRLMDYISCSYPDLSYHGEEAWKADLYNYNRHVGLLFAGKYAGENDKFIYLAINMHWEKHDFALPNLPEGIVWKKKFDSDEFDKALKEDISDEGRITLAPRSVVILESLGESAPDKRNVKRKKKDLNA
ncbi:MAG: hypothetical protein J5537_03340 [Lachnospiraceae bacterium]|nr:hypothetical protein [Lachnospiraceae bacterium]